MTHPDRRSIFTLNDLRRAFADGFEAEPERIAAGGPIYLEHELYDRAKRQGFDMKGYAYVRPPCTDPIFVGSAMFAAAKRAGFDMWSLREIKPIPTSNSVVPCLQHGADCNWPACPAHCVGRPGHSMTLHDARVGTEPVQGSTMGYGEYRRKLLPQTLSPSPAPRWNTCPGSVTHKGNPK